MARSNWLNDDNHPLIEEQLSKLDHFTQSLADGKIDKDELEKQEQALVAAMKSVEGDLSDDVHEKVTKLLAELSAYNVMATLHELAGARARVAFGNK